jgi:hypothetical protein
MDFDYIETCDCSPSCPCPFTGSPSTDYGGCHLLMAFHIVRGTYGSTALDGLNAIMVNEVPGNMRAGGYRTAVYVDERGDADQGAAIEAIFTGKAGGAFEGFDAFTVEWLGVKTTSIEVSTRRAMVLIPDVVEVAYEPIRGFGGRIAALVDTGQRIAMGKKLKVGQSSVSRFDDYGLHWDSSGSNVFWGRYSHSH